MMEETEGESRYPANYGSNQGFGSTQRPKVSVRNAPHPHSHSQQIANNYVDEDEEELEEDEEEQEVNGVVNEINGDDNDNDNDDDDDTEEDDDGENHSRNDNFNLHRHPKKRKLKSLLSSFELAPRLPPPPKPKPLPPPPRPSLQPPPAATSAAKPSFGGRNTHTDWSEHETFVLLESWGERFVKRGRKSLRSEEYQEVADKVSQVSKIERTDTQCRNRLDTLKKKYKKEKSLLESNKNQTTKWVYFKKMDMLMSSSPTPTPTPTTIQQSGLSCGVDSGEYVFTNPTVYLNHANGLDEMRDSPGNTDSHEGGDEDDDDSDPIPLKRSKEEKGNGIGIGINGGSFRLLADSINKFSEIYEKIENGKRKQMVELEKMRMEFHKELELQKREILDRARDEIAKIRDGDYEENDSAENISG